MTSMALHGAQAGSHTLEQITKIVVWTMLLSLQITLPRVLKQTHQLRKQFFPVRKDAHNSLFQEGTAHLYLAALSDRPSASYLPLSFFL